MTFFKTNSVTTQPTNGYATTEDVYHVFDKGVDQLYQLSYLLTGDHRKAEQCFVAGLEDSVKSNRVFKEWAHSWAKRTIIKNAIRELKPRRPVGSLSSDPVPDSTGEPSKENQRFHLDWILSLADFDRFVFVISVLEHYSDRECAMLLDCSPRQVGEARVRGFQQLTDPLLMVALGPQQ